MDFKIAEWYQGYQAPCVLMIDDLSDAYINVYPEIYRNDWGYYGKKENSVFSFLKKNLLSLFPHIKITFFVPYLRHNVINENSIYDFRKFAVGERKEFSEFLRDLTKEGHEIAHHGSNHGEYMDPSNVSTYNNFIHEWELFDDIESGVAVTLKGVQVFETVLDQEICGGKFCGYKKRENSLEIINESNFLYWCDEVNYLTDNYDSYFFGKNEVISFPTNVPGNLFVRLSYLTGNPKKDRIKKFLKYIEPATNFFQYRKLDELYENGQIISIQEHISPATSSGITQSANIVSDIDSLQKIFEYLKNKSIWYATCEEISKYIYFKKNSKIVIDGDELSIIFKNPRKIKSPYITLKCNNGFLLMQYNKKYNALKHNGAFVTTISLKEGVNRFKIVGNE